MKHWTQILDTVITEDLVYDLAGDMALFRAEHHYKDNRNKDGTFSERYRGRCETRMNKIYEELCVKMKALIERRPQITVREILSYL